MQFDFEMKATLRDRSHTRAPSQGPEIPVTVRATDATEAMSVARKSLVGARGVRDSNWIIQVPRVTSAVSE